MTDQIVDAVNFVLTLFAQSTSATLSLNNLRALNSSRCALLSVEDDTWNLLAAIYYTVKFFATSAQYNDIKAWADSTYPMVCTCKEEADKYAAYYGGTAETAIVMQSCSEASQ